MDSAKSNGVAQKIVKGEKTDANPKILNIDNVKSEGCLLWAKIKGYSYWPGTGINIFHYSKTFIIEYIFFIFLD